MPVWQEWKGPSGALAIHEPTSGLAGPTKGVIVVSHGIPVDVGQPTSIPSGLVSLSDRLASDSGWRVVACCLRGVGESEGNFSLAGWLDDLTTVVERASSNAPVNSTILVGIGTGGALSLCIAAGDQSVRAVACLAAPASFEDFASNPAAVAAYARGVGVIKDPKEPTNLAEWARAFTEIEPLKCAQAIGNRSVLVLHGIDDDVVYVEESRLIAQAVGESAELRILAGAGNRLNSDPRAIALLLGWLERQRA
ncbi:MAG: hypothetical protein WAM97_16940 [Acidimicrobiales bacterium]